MRNYIIYIIINVCDISNYITVFEIKLKLLLKLTKNVNIIIHFSRTSVNSHQPKLRVSNLSYFRHLISLFSYNFFSHEVLIFLF